LRILYILRGKISGNSKKDCFETFRKNENDEIMNFIKIDINGRKKY